MQDTGTTTTTQVLVLDLAVRPRILLVEDDELVREELRDLISLAGFEVCTAASGAEALQSLRQNFASVVITDLNMPGMDGRSLARAIREESWPGYIYIFLLTIQDAEPDILAGLEAGADDYLSKRMSTAQLLARLRTAQRILTLEHSLKKALAENRALAMTDTLTGAPNRRYFMRRLNRELKRANRYHGELSLMTLDIDHFKQVNDNHGHAAGDVVLKEVVRRMGACLPRDTDWYARMGGEEFSVALQGTSIAGAAVVAETLRHSVEAAAILTEAGAVNITVSIGLTGLECVAARRSATSESLLHEADVQLYASKTGGRNRVTQSPPHVPHKKRGQAA